MGYPVNGLAVLAAVLSSLRGHGNRHRPLREHLQRYSLVTVVLHDPEEGGEFAGALAESFLDLDRESGAALAFFVLAETPLPWQDHPPAHIPALERAMIGEHLDRLEGPTGITCAYLAERFGVPAGQLPVIIVVDPKTGDAIWLATSALGFRTQLEHLIRHAQEGVGLTGLYLPFDGRWGTLPENSASIVESTLRKRRPHSLSARGRARARPGREDPESEAVQRRLSMEAMEWAISEGTRLFPLTRDRDGRLPYPWEPAARRFLDTADLIAGLIEVGQEVEPAVAVAAYTTAIELEMVNSIVQWWRQALGVRPEHWDTVDPMFSEGALLVAFELDGHPWHVHLNERLRGQFWKPPNFGPIAALVKGAPPPRQPFADGSPSLGELGEVLRQLVSARNAAHHGRVGAHHVHVRELVATLVDRHGHDLRELKQSLSRVERATPVALAPS